MIEVATTILKEVSKEKMNDMPFNEINKKMSPRELLSNSGIIGNYNEVMSIEFDVSTFVIKSFLPKEGGEWSGEKGDSVWYPDREIIPKRPEGNTLTWGEILDKYEIDGIEFKDGEPDFSTISEGTVEIDDFSTDRSGNFTQADEQLAEKWTSEGKDGREWSPQDIKEYRKENNLSWHERSDMNTIDLVPQEVHGNVPHSGGISVAKSMNK
ncbi:MAG: Unknown protein [uncultured Sulfurovum sp.]|uniref:HNH endonuclease n=1 Tax=uncultured Sulfurovum sp. TaxID=269237 RepID=A0A6S6T056_9BACT|nr:MAG: Unknown protein [uncultured Sulfurovum sp.]